MEIFLTLCVGLPIGGFIGWQLCLHLERTVISRDRDAADKGYLLGYESGRMIRQPIEKPPEENEGIDWLFGKDVYDG